MQKAKAKNSEIADLLEEKEELLVYAENGSPWAIDLECLDYGNPMAHAVILALQWAGTVTETLDTEKLMAFFEGYLEAYDE